MKLINNTDVVVVGGGIVGASVAWQLKRARPDLSVCLVEKARAVATQQTGHNSGVVHSGIYYAPGSLKADFCRRGNAATVDFCREHDVAYKRTGKLLVATQENELARMSALHLRAVELGIEVEAIGMADLKDLEPHVSGVGALFVPSTGITDYPAIARRMVSLFEQLGGELLLETCVQSVQEEAGQITVNTNHGAVKAGYMVACAGIQADRIAAMTGIQAEFTMVPFRGEYFRLPSRLNAIVERLIYPIPDPELPFLGVHLTRMIDGSVTVGPNAVLGFAREGYPKLSVDLRDCKDMLRSPGLAKVLRRHFRAGLEEFKNSLWKPGYLALCRRYCPSLALDDLLPAECGIRAQAVTSDGQLVHDFLIKGSARSLHLCNAPSPAATSAIPIGSYVVNKFLAQMDKPSTFRSSIIPSETV